jgi:ComF family protein
MLLKYGGHRVLAEPLASLMFQYLKRSADIPWRRADCIVPMPMYPARRRVRGYNQTELLAEHLGMAASLPVIRNSVARTAFSRPQVELARNDRLSNVRGAFRVTDRSLLSGKTTILVDDVATTSSTIHECSRILLDAGASRVYVMCVAFDE